MRRENRKPTAREMKSITTPGFVRRVVRPEPPMDSPNSRRTDEEILGEIHEQDIARRHDAEDEYRS